jgi:hypothetical protein
MNLIERDQDRNSEFFESAIVERSAARQLNYRGPLSQVFSRAEMVYWAMVGVQIDYLSRDYVRDLFLRYQNSIVDACDALKEIGEFPFPLPEEWPAPQMELSEDGISIGYGNSPDWLHETDAQVHAWKTFQTLMLLISENLLDDETHLFVNSISWTRASEWNAYREGQSDRPWLSGFSESIQLGFAEVIRHWKDESSLLTDAPSKPLPEALLPKRFADVCFYISRHRFHLSNIEVLERYLSYAGSLLQQTKDGSAGWLDLRYQAFYDLLHLVYRGETSTSPIDIPRLWAVFSQNEMPVQSDEMKRGFKTQSGRHIVLTQNEQSEKGDDDDDDEEEEQQEYS